jgi:ribosomal-protein-alanine N-acetyltransferase
MHDETGRASVTIRPLTTAEVDAAVAVFASIAEEGLWVGTEGGFDRDNRAVAFRTSIESPATNRLLAVVTDGGEIIGTGHAQLAPYGVVDIGMALADGWRGQGIGGRLVDELLVECRDLGGHKAALSVFPHNARALALYRSRGFVEEGRLVRHYRRQSGEVWDAVIMGLQLDPTIPGSPHPDNALVS